MGLCPSGSAQHLGNLKLHPGKKLIFLYLFESHLEINQLKAPSGVF
jgi:predicted NUDIX family NTP pyrophosphohydrolase